jgi:two-component system cell cycle response regulator
MQRSRTTPSHAHLGRRLGVWGRVAALVALVAYVLHTAAGLGGTAAEPLFQIWIDSALILGAGIACVLRGVTGKTERAAWVLMGGGIIVWASGGLLYQALAASWEEVPIPSAADALWLSAYPLMYASLVLLVRSRMPGADRSLWLDGAIGALALAAVAATLALDPIMDATTGSFGVVATGLAYVGADLVLLILVTTVFGLSRWRPGSAWRLLGLGLLLLVTVDWLYLLQTANGTYVEGGVMDVLWPASFMLIAFAAWRPADGRQTVSVPGLLPAVVPTAATIIAVVLLAYDHYTRIETLAVVLACLTLIIASLRLFSAFVENQRLLAGSQREALTDPLTGLGNRRQLMRDLEGALAAATPQDPVTVVLMDLNGFKGYNDTFGHPAGDQLLIRLGARLNRVVSETGRAYRLGGDEFCALLRCDAGSADSAAAEVARTLSEDGGGFSISCAHGVAVLPDEVADVEGALALADRRMYAQKGAGRASASRQTRDVLLKALFERGPELKPHIEAVAELARRLAWRLEMTLEEVDEVTRAAELHDIGKVAIPDVILAKPAPLDPQEWAFMQRHTVIGERILGAAPALAPVARIVRSTHERYDGTGYPDALAGEQIPLGARVVFVCDAFNAMTSDRPYSPPLSEAEALAELRLCAGTQFDPRVVEAFCAEIESAHVRPGHGARGTA